MLERLESFTAAEGVLFIGRAQEKTGLFRTEKRRRPDGVTYPWIVRTTGVVNQFYFYCLDADFGPLFIKFCSYFPYTAKLCIKACTPWPPLRSETTGGVGPTTSATERAARATRKPCAVSNDAYRTRFTANS